jgi:drug/metabolite transporter (DMT)-like permease
MIYFKEITMLTVLLKQFIPQDPRTKGMLAALTGALLVSFDSVFVRLSGTGGVNTTFLFGFFTMISMSAIIQTTDQRGVSGALREGGWPLIFSALLMFGSASTFILSIKHTTIANSAIIIGSRPVLTAIFSWYFLRESAGKTLWLAMLAVAGGIAIVVSGSLESVNILGDSLAILAVISLGLNGTLQRKYKKVSRMAIVGMAGFFLAMVMFFFADIASFTPTTWLIMAAMGLASAPLGRVLNAVSTRYILAAEAAMIGLSFSVFATLWAFLLFGEVPPPTTLAGGAAILGTIFLYILVTLKQRR